MIQDEQNSNITEEAIRKFHDAVLEQLQVDLEPEDLRAYSRWYPMLLEANQRVNLTRITDPDEFLLKHIMDSLALIHVLPEIALDVRLHILDLGTGGGLPGIPLAIAFPQHRYWLTDSTGKKIREVQRFVAELGLESQCRVKQVRARELAGKAHNVPHHFNVILARAAGRAEKVAEESSKLLAPGGLLILYLSGRQEVPDRVPGWRMEMGNPFSLRFGDMEISRKFALLRKKKRR